MWFLFLSGYLLARTLRAARAAYCKICKYTFAAIESRGTKGAPEYLRNPARGSNAPFIRAPFRTPAVNGRVFIAPRRREDAARRRRRSLAREYAGPWGGGQLNAADLCLFLSRNPAPQLNQIFQAASFIAIPRKAPVVPDKNPEPLTSCLWPPAVFQHQWSRASCVSRRLDLITKRYLSRGS